MRATVRSPRARRVRAWPGLLALALAACASDPPPALPAGAHWLQDPALSELSGLEASMEHPGQLWAVNDSGSLPRLFRLDEEGRALGRVWITGAWLHDTESLASWRNDGVSWLLLGDVGDNRARRDSVVVHAVSEPAADQASTPVAWSLRFRFPDGPRDVEGMAVDAGAGDLLLVSKRDPTPRFYRVPLSARESDGPVTAQFLASPPAGSVQGPATALDISGNGRELMLLTYDGLYVWRRGAGEDWRQVLARAPLAVPRPQIRKAEALVLPATPGRVLVTGERRPAPLWSGTYDAGAE